MHNVYSRIPLFLTLIACLFIIPACDSGGSNSDSDSTVTATDENSFEMDFSDGSSSSAKATKTGFAFSYSGTNSDGEDVYAVYFSSKKTFDAENPTSGPALAGILFVLGTQNPDGTYPVFDPTSNDISSGQAGGIIVEGFDQPDDSGTRTIRILNGGDVQFSGGDVTDFQSVTASEFVYDPNNSSTSTNGTVNVTLKNPINPKDGVPSFVSEKTINPSGN